MKHCVPMLLLSQGQDAGINMTVPNPNSLCFVPLGVQHLHCHQKFPTTQYHFAIMKFAAALSTLVLVGTTVAAPGTAMRAERHQKRVASGRKGNPLRRVDAVAETNKTNVEYSGNWAGAILIGSGYTSVTGTFTAPTPSTAGSGSAWVGIDGDTCTTAILQTGIDWTLSGRLFILF